MNANSRVDTIHARLTRLLYQNVLFTQGVALLLAAILTAVSYAQRPALSTSWMAAMVAIAAIRWRLACWFERSQERDAPIWSQRAILGATLSGCGWSAGVLISSWDSAQTVQMFAPFMIAGVVAGAVPTLASLRQAFICFACPPVLTLIACSVFSATYEFHWFVVLAAVLFLFGMLECARRFHTTIKEAIRLELQSSREAVELQVARDAALAGSRSKSEFLATVSHEIRTPMNGVIGMASLLLETPLSAEQKEFARIISGSANDLLGIVNDILDFSKLEAGALTLREQNFDLFENIRNVCAPIAHQASAKGLSFTFEVADNIPSQLVGDVDRLRQIIVNLLANALKFTDRGKLGLKVRLHSYFNKTAHLRFEVCDTGMGIPVDKQNQIFKPFSQVDGTMTRRHGGTGLGLSICKRLVEAMNGEIGFESKEGRGSVFWFIVGLAVVPETVIRQQTEDDH
jgi:signal transduction histidine kinase